MIATTSRIDSVSPSLRRPGRLDLEVEIGVPDVQGRQQILRLYLKDVHHDLMDDEVDSIAGVKL